MVKKITAYIFTIIIAIPLCAMDSPLPPKRTDIELISSHNQRISIPLQVALQSPTLADILKSFQEGQTKSIPFTAIDGQTLATVVHIMKSFYKHQDLKGKSLLDAIKKEIFINDSQVMLLLHAFDFLDFMPGIRLLIEHIIGEKSYLHQATSYLYKLMPGQTGSKLTIEQIIDIKRKGQLSDNTINEIGQMYYLITKRDLTNIETSRQSFSLQDYLDYLPEIIKHRLQNEGTNDVVLKLSELQLKDLEGFHRIPQLKSVKRLYLNGNKLATIPAHLFQELTNLRIISLSINRLTELPATIFQGLVNLEHIGLDYNQLSELPEILFNGLNNLRSLHIYNNQLTQLHPRLLTGLNNLNDLRLDHNQLAQLPLDFFRGLDALRYLNLSDNQLQKLPASLFQGLNSLSLLWINNNLLTQDNQQELKNALPKVEIMFKNR